MVVIHLKFCHVCHNWAHIRHNDQNLGWYENICCSARSIVWEMTLNSDIFFCCESLLTTPAVLLLPPNNCPIHKISVVIKGENTDKILRFAFIQRNIYANTRFTCLLVYVRVYLASSKGSLFIFFFVIFFIYYFLFVVFFIYSIRHALKFYLCIVCGQDECRRWLATS